MILASFENKNIQGEEGLHIPLKPIMIRSSIPHALGMGVPADLNQLLHSWQSWTEERRLYVIMIMIKGNT